MPKEEKNSNDQKQTIKKPTVIRVATNSEERPRKPTVIRHGTASEEDYKKE